MPTQPILDISRLSLEFPTWRGTVEALSEVSLDVARGEIVALVGESGSGKSVAAMSAIRLLPPKLFKVTGGSVVLLGHDLLQQPLRSIRAIRGKLVSMVFQEPTSALNPTIRIGAQIRQVLRRHEKMDRTTANTRAVELLTQMQVPDPARVLHSYPFELSGGMRQRVLIAMAFACNPRLLIADEPTTALDVTVQAQVLALIRERARALGTAVLFITHDLAVVSQLSTRVYVMYAGRILEYGPTEEVLCRPRHPYTRALLRSLPDSATPGTLLHAISGTVPSLRSPPTGCRFRERCEIRQERCRQLPPLSAAAVSPSHAAACWFPEIATSVDASQVLPGRADSAPSSTRDETIDAPALLSVDAVEVRFTQGKRWDGKPAVTVHALNGVDLEILRGETLAIVGESGCGKSTLALIVMSLLAPTEGRVRFDGADLRGLTRSRLRSARQRLQMVFQDPQASFNPRMPAWQIISEPLLVAQRLNRDARQQRAAQLAELVGIRADQLERFPHQFSGGQRQRIAIARALALEPQLLVLDEPTSALDVSIQAQILNLLMELQGRLGLTYLFISHNVSVVRHVGDRVAVMYLGQIVELGSAALVLDEPSHPYTRQLIGAVPKLHQRATAPELSLAEGRSNLRLPSGCFFYSRCGQSNAGCSSPQRLRALADGRQVRCHRA